MSTIHSVNPKLRLLNLLRQGNQAAIATFMTLKSSKASQIIVNTGVDFKAILIDCEHGNIGDSDMHDMVTAVAGSGVSPLIRVRGAEGPLIKRALDTGAHGILVPMINTAADARSVVSFAKFPPIGVRGQGSPFACFEHGLATPAEYVSTANVNLLTMVQIESADGLKNVEDICQVDGVDVIFIGPNDLALALLGYAPAKNTEPVFVEAINGIVASAKNYGKKVAMVVVDGEGAKKAKERFDLVVLSADARALQAWYRQELNVARG
ncbi:hypothetical protein LTR85_005850 [Meristemomyces frigidus]|nr:hypothetical protein LTR85_005850 [Meristemomyces frigidus]